MRSLFERLWLSYVLVMAVTLAVASAVTFALAIKRSEDLNSLSPITLAASAQAALTRQGRDGVDGWVVQEAHAYPELRIYFLDPNGAELLSRKVRGTPLPGAEGQVDPRVVAPDGVVYRVVARRTRNLVFDVWNVLLKPWVMAGLAIGISGLGCAWLARQLTRPVLRLREGVRAIAAGDLDVRMGPDLAARRDELGGLARDFDSMADDLRAHIASKEELLRDISHELRSPLARLRLASGLARKPATSAGALDRIDREVERLDAMIGQILRFSRLGSGPAPAGEPIELADLVEECVEDAGIEAEVDGKSVRLQLAASPWVVGDRTQLRSAIENVLRNAVRFTPPGAALEVALAADGAVATLEVRDRGPGVSETDLPRLFEPFFRGEPSEGVGLGLAIAQRIAERHGGRIEAANLASGGLGVRLTLPLAEAAAPRGHPPAPQEPTAAGPAGGLGAPRRAAHREADCGPSL